MFVHVFVLSKLSKARPVVACGAQGQTSSSQLRRAYDLGTLLYGLLCALASLQRSRWFAINRKPPSKAHTARSESDVEHGKLLKLPVCKVL